MRKDEKDQERNEIEFQKIVKDYRKLGFIF